MRFAVPIRTLSDDYQDEPAKPEEASARAPAPPGPVRRVVDRLMRRAHPGD
jgi:hypothetical protein